MDAKTFDAVARGLVGAVSRRQTVRGLLAGSLAAVTGGALNEAAAAKCKKAGAPCRKSKECCPSETDRLCRVQRNAGNSDTTCCGVVGAECGGKDGNGDDKKPFCCVGHECRGRTCRRA